MPTLSEYAKLEMDEMKSGVLEAILTGDALMPFLQWKSIEGNSLLYNRESTLPTAAFHDVGSEDWVATEATYTQKTAALKILGIQSKLDRYAKQTRSSVQSQEGIVYAGMAKALARKIAQYVIKGEPTSEALAFEGLDSLVRGDTRMMAMDDGAVDGPGTAETELTIDRLDAMIDEVYDGQQKPDLLIMNSTMRRKLTSLARAAGSGIVMDNVELFGYQITRYDGIPIVVTNWVTNAETYDDAGTWPSSTATSIFALVLGEENQGHTMLHNGPVLTPDIQPLGTAFDGNNDEYRMVVYLNAAVFSAERVAALGGIDSAS